MTVSLSDHVITHEGELDGGHTVSSRLSFWRVQRSDEGEYICRGQNDLDVTEKRVRLRGRSGVRDPHLKY